MFVNTKRYIKNALRKWRWYQWKYYSGNPVSMRRGIKLFLNPKCDSSRSLYSKRSSQPDLVRFFSRIISSDATIIDVGANIGYLTTYFSSLVKKSGKVLAFEPDSRAFHFLEKNLILNNCINTQPYHVAVSDRVGTSQLYLSSNRTGNNVLYELTQDRLDEPGRRSSVAIETTTLDQIFLSSNSANQTILKIDVEGFEFKVLIGGEKLFETHPSLITVIEYCPQLMQQAGTSSQEFSSFCSRKQLVIFQLIAGGNLKLLDHQGLEKLNQELMSNPHDLLHKDLVLIHNNNFDDIQRRGLIT